MDSEYFDVVVIGGGQAGLSVGHYLAQRGLRFVILDASERIGDSWRKRWDSLRLFTPSRFCGLSGMPFPAPPDSFPTKNDMADYLEAYAARFRLPVRSGVRVEHLTKREGRFVMMAKGRCIEADQVVVAMASYQRPRVPDFAPELRPEIVQLHSADYRNPSQMKPGPVLIAGAGNSGSEIALELSARGHRVWMSGRETGYLPFRIDGRAARLFLCRFFLRFLFHLVLTVKTPIGRRVRLKVLGKGGPLIRVKPGDLTAARVERTPRMAGVRDGSPLLDDGRVLDVANVVWCTGFHPGFSWIDLPIFDQNHEPLHHGGVVPSAPGLYFVGLHFLYALSSTMIHGVGRDAARIVDAIAAKSVEQGAVRHPQTAAFSAGLQPEQAPRPSAPIVR
jgi:putative flavoprotein involved in K+ transport